MGDQGGPKLAEFQPLQEDQKVKPFGLFSLISFIIIFICFAHHLIKLKQTVPLKYLSQSLTHIMTYSFEMTLNIILFKFKLRMLNTYRDYYYKYYTAKGFTSTHALCLIMAYITLALPFYFCFSATNFWTDTHSNVMNVNYNYTGYYAVQVNYISGTTSLVDQYCNIPNNGMSSPSATSRSVSLTNDDQANVSTTTISLAGYSTFQVLSTNLILYYDVQIQSMEKVLSQAISISIPGNVNTATLTGIVKIEGNQPISGLSSVSNVNFPLYFPYQAAGFTFSTLNSFLIQNSGLLKTTTQSNIIYSSSNSRSISLTLNKIKTSTVNYYPAILQTLKFKYSSYLAFAIISYYIFSTLFKLYINQGMLESETQVQKIKLR